MSLGITVKPMANDSERYSLKDSDNLLHLADMKDGDQVGNSIILYKGDNDEFPQKFASAFQEMSYLAKIDTKGNKMRNSREFFSSTIPQYQAVMPGI